MYMWDQMAGEYLELELEELELEVVGLECMGLPLSRPLSMLQDEYRLHFDQV
jgi:hypothetical protein